MTLFHYLIQKQPKYHSVSKKINAQQQIYWDLVSTKTKKNDQS